MGRRREGLRPAPGCEHRRRRTGQPRHLPRHSGNQHPLCRRPATALRLTRCQPFGDGHRHHAFRKRQRRKSHHVEPTDERTAQQRWHERTHCRLQAAPHAGRDARQTARGQSRQLRFYTSGSFHHGMEPRCRLRQAEERPHQGHHQQQYALCAGLLRTDRSRCSRQEGERTQDNARLHRDTPQAQATQQCLDCQPLQRLYPVGIHRGHPRVRSHNE